MQERSKQRTKLYLNIVGEQSQLLPQQCDKKIGGS